jgi:hypothetical protein
MPYSIERLDTTVPAVLTRITNPMDPSTELVRMLNELDDLMSRIEGKVVYSIVDASHLTVNFADVVAGLASAFRPGSDAAMPHLFNRRVTPILIGSGALLMLLVKSIRQQQYGRRHMQLFTTLDEALAHISQTHAVEEA